MLFDWWMETCGQTSDEDTNISSLPHLTIQRRQRLACRESHRRPWNRPWSRRGPRSWRVCPSGPLLSASAGASHHHASQILAAGDDTGLLQDLCTHPGISKPAASSRDILFALKRSSSALRRVVPDIRALQRLLRQHFPAARPSWPPGLSIRIRVYRDKRLRRS